MINAAVMATVSTVLPGFLIGAMSVQVSAEMGVSEGVYGWGLGSFFGAAMVGSIMLGRLAQRIGPLNQMTLAHGVTIAVQLALAATARSFLAVIAFLVVAGLANAANQTSVNLALAQAQLPRLGLAVSIKQSGLPTATLLAGFAVPSLALTVGWRWAYVAAAAFALVSLAAGQGGRRIIGVPDRGPHRRAGVVVPGSVRRRRGGHVPRLQCWIARRLGGRLRRGRRAGTRHRRAVPQCRGRHRHQPETG